MFARKKKSNIFNETLSPEMLNMSENGKRTHLVKRDKQSINGTSYFASDSCSRLKQGTNKYRSKSRSALDEEEENEYFKEKKCEKFGHKLREKASNLRKKISSISRNQLNDQTLINDQEVSNFKLNFSNEQLDLPDLQLDSEDLSDESNLKFDSSKSGRFAKFFLKSESQPVTRKNSDNEKNLCNSKLTRMSLPSKIAKNGSLFHCAQSSQIEKLINNNWFAFSDQNLEIYAKPNSVVLWSGQKEVTESGILAEMSKRDIELQERWFEIYTSEISYYKTLKILDQIILSNFQTNLKIQDFNLVLITNLKEIIAISEKMILALDSRIKNSVIIENMFDILIDTMNDDKFQKIYIDYAGEKSTQKENYDNLKRNNKKFNDLMQKLNFNPILEGKDVQTYFIAPIQRLSRYKLLVDAILNVLPEDSPHIEEGTSLSNLINKILKKANKKAAETLNFSEAVKLLLLLKFQNNEIKLHQLFQNRELLYHSDLLSVKSLYFSKKEDIQNSLKRNKYPVQPIHMYHVILLTDLLFICKKEENQGGSFFYKVILKAEKRHVHLEFCEWEELNDEHSSQEDNEIDVASKSYLLIFTIFKDDTDTRCITRMLNKKYIFLCTKQEGQVWLNFFESSCEIFRLESDEDESFI